MSFEEEFIKHLTERIENPGDVSSSEVFVIRCSKEDMERIFHECKMVRVDPLPLTLPEEQ